MSSEACACFVCKLLTDDGDDVGAVGSHVNQITAGTMRELNSVDCAFGSNDIGDVRD
jgi:hypothetical protein